MITRAGREALRELAQTTGAIRLSRRSTLEPVELEERAEGKTPRIAGYAAVFFDGSEETEYPLWEGAVERIQKGAFDRALAERQDVRALFNHDPNQILGRSAAGTLELKADSRGLRYSITPADTDRAKELLEHIRRGDISGSSFAFLPRSVRWVTDEELEVRQIEDVDLYDVGPVTYPAYEATSAAVRAATLEELRRELAEHHQARGAARASEYRKRRATHLPFLP